jgi:hypothetical protein
LYVYVTISNIKLSSPTLVYPLLPYLSFSPKFLKLMPKNTMRAQKRKKDETLST